MKYIEVNSFEELEQKEIELVHSGYRHYYTSPVTEYGYVSFIKGVSEVRIKCLFWGT